MRLLLDPHIELFRYWFGLIVVIGTAMGQRCTRAFKLVQILLMMLRLVRLPRAIRMAKVFEDIPFSTSL